nr:hypothetical protein [Propionicimonas sp.]
MRNFATEPAIYGVVLVAGLVVIVGESAEASWDVFIKVCATVGVFWAAHVYAATVAHLDDEPDSDRPLGRRIAIAAHAAIEHSWGMLLAAVIPLLLLFLGHWPLLDDEQTVWGSLWLSVILLGVLGYAKVALWTPSLKVRLASAAITSALGLVLVLLKVAVH